MKVIKNVFSVFLGSLPILSCNSNPVTCSSKEVIETVVEIAKKNAAEGMGQMFIDFGKTKIALTDIRTRKNKDIIECAANIKFDLALNEPYNKSQEGTIIAKALFKMPTSGSITYTVEKTDDGKDFYVEVEGLE